MAVKHFVIKHGGHRIKFGGHSISTTAGSVSITVNNQSTNASFSQRVYKTAPRKLPPSAARRWGTL